MSEGNLLIPETTRNGQNDRLEAYPTDRTLRDALADISLQASAKLNRLEAEVQELPPELLQLLTPESCFLTVPGSPSPKSVRRSPDRSLFENRPEEGGA